MDFKDILNTVKSGEKPITGTKKQRELEAKRRFGESQQGINGLAASIFAANPDTYNYTANKDYQKYGIRQSHLESTYDLRKALSDRQGIATKARNAIIRSVGDTVLDMGAGFANLVSLPIDAISAVTGNYDSTFTNPVSNLLTKWREQLDEEFKIHRETDSTVNTGALGDFSWYLDNMPSLFSTLSLMIPASAGSRILGKTASFIGKAAKLGKESAKVKAAEQAANAGAAGFNRAVNVARRLDDSVKAGNEANTTLKGWAITHQDKLKSVANVISNGTISRMLENYQEAHGVYNNAYEMALDKINSMDDDEYERFIQQNGFQNMSVDDMAKAVAKQSADEDFKDNLGNVVFDIIQYAGLRSMWQGASSIKPNTTLKKAQEKLIGNMTKTEAAIAAEKTTRLGSVLHGGKTAGKWLWNNKFNIAAEATEGMEEMVNYISEQEGNYVAKAMLGMETDKSKIDSERLFSYFRDGQLWDSAFWGFLGGVLFSTAGEAVMNKMNYGMWHNIQDEKRKSEIEARQGKLEVAFAKLDALNKGINPYTNQNITQEEKDRLKTRVMNDAINDIALDEARVGNINLLKSFIEDERIQKLLVDKGIVNKDEIAGYTNSLLNNISNVEQTYNNELVQLTDMANRLNSTDELDFDVLPEYLDAIATTNTRNRFELQQTKSELSKVENEINKEKERLGQTTTIPDFIENYYKMVAVSSKIASLEYRKKTIEENKKLGDNVEINRINKEIDRLKNTLNKEDISPIIPVFAQLSSSAWKVGDNGFLTLDQNSISNISSEDFQKIDSSITDEDISTHFNNMKELFKLENNVDTKTLTDLYKQSASLRGVEDSLQNDYINSHTKLLNSLSNYNVTLNKTVRETNDQIIKRFVKWAKKYNAKEPGVLQTILQQYIDNKDNINFNIENLDLSKINNKEEFLEDFEKMKRDITAYTAISLYENQNSFTAAADNIGYLMSELETIDKLKDIIRRNTKEAELLEAASIDDTDTDTDTNTEKSTTQSSPTNPDTTKAEIDKELKKAGFTDDVITFDNSRTPDILIKFDEDLNITKDRRGSTSAIKLSNGNYVLDAKGGIYYKMDKLYDKEGDNFDHEKPVKIISHPYVSIDETNGKVIVKKKGVIKNIEVNEPTDSTTETTPIEDIPAETKGTKVEDNSQPSNNNENNEEANQLKETQKKFEAIIEDKDDSISDQLPAADKEFGNDTFIVVGKYLNDVNEQKERLNEIADSKEFNGALQEIVKKIPNKYRVQPGIQSKLTEINTALGIAKQKNKFLIRLNFLASNIKIDAKTIKEYQDLFDDYNVVESQINIITQKLAFTLWNDRTKLFENIEENLNQLLQDYIKLTHAPKVNGKYYISLAPLFEFTESIPYPLYPVLVKFMKKHSDKYVAMDNIEDKNEILFPSKPTNNGVKSNGKSIRINIFDDIIHKNDDAKTEFWKVFETLNKGEEVSITTDEKRPDLLIIKRGDDLIGTLTVPKVTNDGFLEMGNNGIMWRYNPADKYGDDSAELLYDLFNTDVINGRPSPITHRTYNNIEELRDNVYQLAFNRNLKEEDKEEIISKWKDYDVFKDIFKNILINYSSKNDTKSPDYNAIAKGFVVVARYVNDQGNRTSTMDSIKTTLDSYIAKKFDNWNETRNIYDSILKGVSPRYIISNITEGRLLRFNKQSEQETVTDQTIIGLNSDITSQSSHRIGIVVRGGNLRIAGVKDEIPKKDRGNRFVTDFTPFIAMPMRGNERDYLSITTKHLKEIKSKPINDISKAIVNELYRLIEACNDSKVDYATAWENLGKFLEELNIKSDRGNINNSLISGFIFTKCETDSGQPYYKIQGANSNEIITIYDKRDQTVPIYHIKNGKKTKGNKGSEILSVDNLKDKKIFENIIGNCRINIDPQYILDDLSSENKTSGIVQRKDGKLNIVINEQVVASFDSYNQMILENQTVKADICVENGSNYSRKKDEYSSVQPTIEIKTTQGYMDSGNEIPNPVNKLKEQIKSICEDDTIDNKGIAIVDAIIDHATLYDSSFKEKYKKQLDLIKNNPNHFIFLPKIVKFTDEEKLNKEQYEVDGKIEPGAWAATIKPKDKSKKPHVVIGDNFMSLLDINASKDRTMNIYNPLMAIEQLMHEELHIKFMAKENQKVYENLKDIQEKFNDWHDEVKDVNEKKFFEHYRNITLEEFVVRTLTDDVLAKKLNDIEIDHEDGTVEKHTLFSKLIDFLCELFDFKINKKSLLHKEYLALAEVVKAVDTKAVVDKITADSKNLKLSDDEVGYLDKDNTLHYRITSLIRLDTEYINAHEKDNANSKEIGEKYKTVSTNIGTTVDEFVRDFFNGLLDNLSDDELETKYANATGNQWGEFRKQLIEFKKQLDKQGIKIIPRDVTVRGKITLDDGSEIDAAGTVDLLGEKDGKLYIFDMKTMRNDKTYNATKHTEWSLQLSRYKDFIEKTYGGTVEGLYIIPIMVNYDVPETGTEYTLKDESLLLNTSDATRTQLLYKGEEFKNAQPQLFKDDDKIKLVELDYKEANISKNDFDNYKESLNKTENKETSKTVDEELIENFYTDESDPYEDDEDIAESTINLVTNDDIITSNSQLTLNDLVQSVSPANVKNLSDLVQNGEVEYHC
uniref:Uncharacterized protein n=1 Tax=Geladintestivirus 1 TaxID=3233133 RepID=A0AAU8MKJ6_9CAUD